jgi:hypothetical protein
METFVIQIPPRPEANRETGAGDVRGVIEHVGSGRRETFTNASELLAFLHADYRDAHKEAER